MTKHEIKMANEPKMSQPPSMGAAVKFQCVFCGKVFRQLKTFLEHKCT